MKTIVVVYYSRTGKTRAVAERLAAMLEADLEDIRETKDRSGVLGYVGAGRDALRKAPSELASTHTTEGRRVIVLGMPVWGFNPPPAILAYLLQVDLKGRKMAAFATQNGSGAGKTLNRVAQRIPDGLATRLELTRPRIDDPDLLKRLEAWAEEIRKL